MKRLVVSLFVLFSVSPVFSQNTFNKQYHFGWPAVVGNGIYVTDSCYYFSGLFLDSISPYRAGLLFGKMDLEGNIIQYNSINDTSNTYENWLTPLVYSMDSHFISMGYGVDTLGRYNYWMKLSETGGVINTKKFRNTYFPIESATRVNDFFQHPVSSKYYVLNEAFIRENDLGVTSGYHAAITILNENGDSLNNWVYTHPFYYLPQKILFSNDNEIIIGVQKTNSNLTRINLEYYSKIFAVDTLGQVLWQWQSPHSVQQGANDMLATDDGGLVVVSGRGFLERVNPETDYAYWDRGVVFKLDSNHQVEWECEFTESYPNPFNKFNKIVEATDNFGYVAAGSMWVWLNEDNASYLGWLAKVSPQGDSLWSRKLFYYEYPDSLEYEHEIHDLHATPDGGYIMSGETLDREGISRPIQQAWYIKVDSEGCLIPGCGVVDTREPDSEGPPLLLYPNPTTDYLNVYMGDTGGKEWSFVIYNSLGQQMGTYRAHSAHTTYMIDVGHWPSGQYFLRVSDAAGVEMRSYGFFKD